MTNEELLQQAKDQVAKAWIKDNQGFIYSGDEAWLHFTRAAWYDNSVLREMEVAALLAIQSAREEAAPKWIPSTTLPESGQHVLLHCFGSGTVKPSGERKMFICTGFYTAERKTECWVDDYDEIIHDGVDDDGDTLWLLPGWYECEEQYNGVSDEHYFRRDVFEWMPIPETSKLTAPGR